jgi:ferredoxin, 2Fe-2S
LAWDLTAIHAYPAGCSKRQNAMVRITFVSSRGESQTFDALPGLSLMESAVANGVEEIDADCGGNCYCGTCRVYVGEVWQDRLPPPDNYEIDMVDSTDDDTPGVRLACQLRVTEQLDGLVVRTPPSQR